MYIKTHTRRRRLIFSILFLLFVLCLGRLFFIQCFRNEYLSLLARKQQNLFISLEPHRGSIFDRNLKPQAINLPSESLYTVPGELKHKDKVAQQLASVLNMEQEPLRAKLDSTKQFVWLARKLSLETANKVCELNHTGLYFIKESRRVYPNFHLASHLIGFAGLDNKGLEGIELVYDKYLAGSSGWGVLLRDARQERLGLWEKLVLPNDGYNVILTIDEIVQFIVEHEIDLVVKKYKPQGVSAIVMDPSTGEILALANRPTFDLNKTPQTEEGKRRNRAIADMFEPGSVFKIVTAAAAMEELDIDEKKDKIFCEKGAYKITKHTLHDHRPHGWLSFKDVFVVSSNIGVAKIAKKLGNEQLYRYVRKFGFGQRLGINLPGEIAGIIRRPKDWSKLSIAMVPMGQEVGVTALQLATALSAVANNGTMMKPYVVKKIQDKYGSTIESYSPQVLSQVISPETSERVTKILTEVVDKGTGKQARIKGVRVAGKTGTAQKVESNGRYSHDKFIASFIAFAPADDPQLVVVFVVDNPRGQYFGGVVSAPAVKNICENTLKYLQVKQ